MKTLLGYAAVTLLLFGAWVAGPYMPQTVTISPSLTLEKLEAFPDDPTDGTLIYYNDDVWLYTTNGGWKTLQRTGATERSYHINVYELVLPKRTGFG